MLPAPHSTFLDHLRSIDPRRPGSNDRQIVADNGLGSPMACRPKRIFGPIASFLASRIGARWSHVLAELSDRLGDEAKFRLVLPRLSELVEFNVVEINGKLCHGSGLLKGQALLAGWRRRLYVCPVSGRLKRITLPLTAG